MIIFNPFLWIFAVSAAKHVEWFQMNIRKETKRKLPVVWFLVLIISLAYWIS